VCVNKTPLNKRKILLDINYDVCSPSSFFFNCLSKDQFKLGVEVKVIFSPLQKLNAYEYLQNYDDNRQSPS
jgi:hypothetical protein